MINLIIYWLSVAALIVGMAGLVWFMSWVIKEVNKNRGGWGK